MKELRASARGKQLRVLYAFNPERTAILLIGGDKTGDPGWYDRYVPIADGIFEDHLKELQTERTDDKPRRSK